MTEIIARVCLLIGMVVSLTMSWYFHGKQIRTFRFHATLPTALVISEAILIWFAGGWG